MITTDVLIVGGGPAGSACAWKLKQLGVDCLVLDQQNFPRSKPCAGWITPQVVKDLALDPLEYAGSTPQQRLSFTTFSASHVWIYGFHIKTPSHQHAIRRFEFDNWLLKRSGARFIQHTVKTIVREGDTYLIDTEYRAKYLVGAGGTNCPVYRALFGTISPRQSSSLIVALEEEFPYNHSSNECWLWFFENHLPGYAWFVPKANGFVNVGIGGKMERLKARGDNLKDHWNRFIEKLDRLGLVKGHTYKPRGHSYYLRQKMAAPVKDQAYLVGDSAGLATLDLGEGIGPAIRSGISAAESIASGSPYRLDTINRYSDRLGFFLSLGLR